MNCIWGVLVHICLSLISSRASGVPNDFIHSYGNVTGKITFRQIEGNSTYLRDSGELASYIPTVVSFEHSRRNLRNVTFIYTWDLGNGEVLVGPDPFVVCSYTSPGNYTFKLSIEANATRRSRFSGLYSADLTVLDAIRSIELKGPLNYNVDQSSRLSFQVGGSPPAWLCWRLLPDCFSPSPASCNLIRLYDNIFNLNFTFTSVGTYCLDLSVRNDISNLQTSYNIYVQNSPVSHLIFILPCAAVIFATLIFICVSVCRSKAQVADMNYLSFTDIEMDAKNESIRCSSCLSSNSERNEAQPLLHQSQTSL